jgi:DNA-directed RNA polymerase specialized sigma24 family protein
VRRAGGTDDEFLAALRRGDADAFARLVDRHSPAMIRVAMAYVPSGAAAEEAVQEAWIGVMRGIGGFEGRSSLKTWIFRIRANATLTHGSRRRCSVTFWSSSACSASSFANSLRAACHSSRVPIVWSGIVHLASPFVSRP